jgi:hypothetical protein
VFQFPALIRQALQAPVPAGDSLQNIINTQLVPQLGFVTPSILRRAGTAAFGYDLTPHWTLNAMYFRESQRGNRPIGTILNSVPGASTTSGFGEELPEPIRYYNNLVRIGFDYGRNSRVFDMAYTGSFFQNDIHQMTWDNPFQFSNETVSSALTGRMALYPDNQANYISFAGATDLTKYLRLTASISPGWLRQDAAFLPYSTNTAIKHLRRRDSSMHFPYRIAGKQPTRRRTDLGDELYLGKSDLEELGIESQLPAVRLQQQYAGPYVHAIARRCQCAVAR